MTNQEFLKYAPKPKKLQDEKEWNVFLSYRSINRPWVLNLYDTLTELGHKVFLDQYVLVSSGPLIRQLEEALEKSQAGIIIWSNEARDSDWVKKEYYFLEDKATNDTNFHFVPIRLNQINLPGFANNRIFLDFTAYPDGPNGSDLIRLLHAIVGLPLSPNAVKFSNDFEEVSAIAFAQVNASIRSGRTERLLELFSNGGLSWDVSAALGCKAANGLIKLEKYSEAIVILEQLEKKFPKSLRPQQLKALAYARRGLPGDLDEAQEILGILDDRNHLDPETLGIYARTYMDQYDINNDINDLKKSRQLYADAFNKAPDDFYTGINAAAKSLFLGTEKDRELANKYANEVQKIVGIAPHPNNYWKTATVAEAFLIKGQFAEAADMYDQAILMEPKSYGSHETTKKQALKILEKLNADKEKKTQVLSPFDHLNIT